MSRDHRLYVRGLPYGVAQWMVQETVWQYGLRPIAMYIMRHSVPWLNLSAENHTLRA